MFISFAGSIEFFALECHPSLKDILIMARITVEDCLDKVATRYELIILAAKRARQLATGGRRPTIEWDNDKPTLVALREIEAGLLDKETLDRTLEEDVLMDGFSSPDSEVPETAE